VHEIPGFVEYRLADAIFGLSQQNQGWTARTTNIRTLLFISMRRILNA
jgi:hypothetical protein